MGQTQIDDVNIEPATLLEGGDVLRITVDIIFSVKHYLVKHST